jgi:CDP-diglyceride synthetase
MSLAKFSLARFRRLWFYGTGMTTFVGGCYGVSNIHIYISPRKTMLDNAISNISNIAVCTFTGVFYGCGIGLLMPCIMIYTAGKGINSIIKK